ncbi:MAG: hemerythrin domain-containing protein [Proteobacteria bacterium]|nr:hemerythrin domain-containing protein [Pseudomonadota bacterium]MDA0952988.1 hemerythrin domain-containing protein [Pseudomonadota bacterium]
MPTIYEVLKKDHDSHREVLKRLDATSGDSPEREELYATMKQEVEAHTAAEEETFYATLMARPEGQEKARHSVSEHKEAVDLLGELDDTAFSSPGWLPRFRKLKEELEHHMDEEENEIFKRARKLIAEPEARELGEAFLERKQAEL